MLTDFDSFHAPTFWGVFSHLLGSSVFSFTSWYVHAFALISFHFHLFPLTFQAKKTKHIMYKSPIFFGSCAIYFHTRNFSVRLVHFPSFSFKITRFRFRWFILMDFSLFSFTTIWLLIWFVVLSHFNVPVFGELRHLFCSGVFPFISSSFYSFSPVLVICSSIFLHFSSCSWNAQASPLIHSFSLVSI